MAKKHRRSGAKHVPFGASKTTPDISPLNESTTPQEPFSAGVCSCKASQQHFSWASCGGKHCTIVQPVVHTGNRADPRSPALKHQNSRNVAVSNPDWRWVRIQSVCCKVARQSCAWQHNQQGYFGTSPPKSFGGVRQSVRMEILFCSCSDGGAS